MSTDKYLSLPDAVLVQKARQGNAKAWGELVKRYKEPLFAFICFRMQYKIDQAEVVCQNTWEGAIRGLKNLRKSFKTYLFAIAEKQSARFIRDLKLRRKIEGVSIDETRLTKEGKEIRLSDELATKPVPDDEARQAEAMKLRRLEQALEQLSPDDREIIKAWQTRSLSDTERVRFFRAKQRLSEIMKGPDR